MTSISRIRRKILRRFRKAPRGSNSVYVQISGKRGVKINHSVFSPGQFFECSVYKSALHESRVMKLAKQRYPYIPECYGVKFLKLNKGRYTSAIFIEHLGNKRLSDVVKDCVPILGKVKDHLYQLGIRHADIHGHNVMYFKGKYWVIDFEYVRVTPKQ